MPVQGPEPTRRYFVGLDLGQRRDYTALVVVEKTTTPFWGDQWLYARKNETGTTRLLVRMAEKVRLSTPYPEIVEWVKSIVTRPEFQKRTALTVDSTGVGTPVVDLLRKAQLGVNWSRSPSQGSARPTIRSPARSLATSFSRRSNSPSSRTKSRSQKPAPKSKLSARNFATSKSKGPSTATTTTSPSPWP